MVIFVFDLCHVSHLLFHCLAADCAEHILTLSRDHVSLHLRNLRTVRRTLNSERRRGKREKGCRVSCITDRQKSMQSVQLALRQRWLAVSISHAVSSLFHFICWRFKMTRTHHTVFFYCVKWLICILYVCDGDKRKIEPILGTEFHK